MSLSGTPVSSSSLGSALILNVTIISIAGRDRFQAIPGYQAGVDYVRSTNPNIHVHHVHIDKPSVISCAVLSLDLTDIAAEYFYKRRKASDFTVFLSPLCAQELVIFAPLVNQWNVLALASAGSDATISNKTMYPTVLTGPTNHNGFYRLFMQKLFQYFRWKTIFMLCDKNDVVSISFYQVQCLNLHGLLESSEYEFYYTDFDNRKAPVDYENYLKYFAATSRVMVLLARWDVVRTIMITASRLNMTGSDYIYLYSYPYIQPPGFTEAVWKVNDQDDEITRNAYKSMLSITFDNEDRIDALPVTSKLDILEKSKVYNITYTGGAKISSATVAAFEALLTTTIVLQEVLDEHTNGTAEALSRNLSDARSLARRFWNRTFHLPTGEVYFDENGDHSPDIQLRQFNWHSGKYEPAMRFDAETLSLVNDRPEGIIWPDGRPPLNEPLCGYDGLKAVCGTRGNTNVILAATLSSVAIVVVTVVAAMRYHTIQLENASPWWHLSLSSLDLTYLARKSYTAFCSQAGYGYDDF